MSGVRPNMFNFDTGYRDTFRRPIYVTVAELRNWAIIKYNQGEEENPYYDYLDKWQDAMKQIAAIFDGSGTYTNPITGEEVNLPQFIEDWHDIDDMMRDDYNTRFVAWPLFPLAHMYKDDNDEEWAWIMDVTCRKIKRFCYRYMPGLIKVLGSLSIEYNPIADYWSKSTELGGSAPYISLTNPSTGEEPTISNWNSDSAHTSGYRSEQKALTGNDQPEVDNYTTTYDDASTGRLSSYSTSKGGTETTSQLPNSGYVKKNSEEGNKGQNIQDLLLKEMELGNAMENIVTSFMKGLEKEILLSYYTGA